ncbi:MAG: mechanosensitive ion channel family protein, partial [Sphingobacterium sp.]
MKTNAQSNKPKLPIGFIAKIIAVGLLIGFQILFTKQIDQNDWLPQKINSIHSFLIPSIALSIVRFIIIILYNTRNANKTVRGNFVLGINRLTAVLNTVIALVALMIMFGINPKEFITSMTIVAMAIAVLFRDYITNMVSGLIIMFSDQLSVGDRIQVGENKGRIIDITLVNLVLQNEEDDILMVPNNYVFNSTFLNLSAHQSSLFTVKFELPLSVSIHIEKLEEQLKMSITT